MVAGLSFSCGGLGGLEVPEMRNTYQGVCYRCGEIVAPGKGHFEKTYAAGRSWRVQHADCAIRWRGKPAPTKEEARAARVCE